MIIGTVMNVSVTATNVSYTIGDGTGYIDARKWLDSADENGADDSQSQYVFPPSGTG
jgi:replication factor A2